MSTHKLRERFCRTGVDFMIDPPMAIRDMISDDLDAVPLLIQLGATMWPKWSFHTASRPSWKRIIIVCWLP